MSKRDKNTTPAAEPATQAPAVEPTTEAAEPATEAAEPATEAVETSLAQTVAPDIVPATSLAPVVARDYPEELDTGIAFDPHGPHAAQILLKLFPAAARQLRSYRPVSEEELTQMVLGLPPELRQNLQDALDRMNPEMLGMHSSREQTMRLFNAKIFHGTGKDPSRPKILPPGGIYATDGRILAVHDADTAVTLKAPAAFRAYVIASFEGRTLWPPEEEGEGEGGNRVRAPLCSSVDRVKGDTYGLCDACAHRPFQGDKERGDCMNEHVFFVVPEDFSGIYRWAFAKTGLETSKAVLKTMRAGWRSMWEKQFSFITKEESGKDNSNRWYVAVPTAVNTPTPPAVAAALQVLARKIDTEVFWPAQRAVHLRAANPALRNRRVDAAAAEPAKKTDGAGLAALAGLAGGAAPKALPDLAGGGRRNV